MKNYNKRYEKIKPEFKIITTLTIFIMILSVFLTNEQQLTKILSTDKSSSTYLTGHNSTINKDFIYLTDLEYDKELTISPYLRIDQNVSNNLITVSINGNDTIFLKGLFLHSAGTAVYDISRQDYDYFTAYIGLDVGNRAAHEGDGVRFKIYTSVDKNQWTEVLNDNNFYTSSMDAKEVKIDIRSANYLKLVTEAGRNNWSDHSVFANAKLIKENYIENNTTTDFIKPVTEYDTKLKQENIDSILKDEELPLLQRKFISSIGYDVLQAYTKYSDEYKEAIEWLITDKEALRYFITGGTPSGSYANALKIFIKLYTNNKTDLENSNITKFNIKLSDLYKRMIITLSLTHSASVCAWYDRGQCSDALTRYEIYKKLQKEEKLENKIFETLTIEEMRWVMNNQIADEEIEWLNDWARQFPVESGNRKGPYNREPYRYIAYTNGYNYGREQYYSEENYEKWNQKYFLKKYNLTYEKGHPKLWIVFEEGGVCGATSKLGSNLNAVFGYPTAVIGQPGHAAYLEYWQADNGDGYWGIQNNISGWTQSEKGERLLNAWGSYKWDSYYQVSYVPYGQYAQNHVEEYNKAVETLLLLDIYPNNTKKQEEIYRKALEYEEINMDAWYGLIQLYKNKDNTTDREYYDLAKELMNSLKNFPLPMMDLLNLFKNEITEPEYQVKYTLLEKSILEEATKVTDSTVGQIGLSGVTKTMAKFLLGKNDYSLATFSFDGENAGRIVLSNKFEGTQVHYEYSIDGKHTWKQTLDPKVKLTQEELNQINANDDIAIHLVGAAADDIFVIDIRTQDIPENIYNNDLENRVIGVSDTMEWRINQNDEWTLFSDKEPDLTGDKTIYVRHRKHGVFLAGEEKTLRFSKDNINEKRKYIPISHLSIHNFSTEATNQGRYARNAIDGNYYTNWHSAWNGTDTERYISIKLDKQVYLSAVEYVPGGGGNGKILDGTLYGSIDGKEWTPLTKVTNWAANENIKSFELEESKKVQYIKIVADRASNGNWIVARMFNFFEDTTKIEKLTADIEYSTTQPTENSVIARLVNANRSITITNNGGKDTYIFTENGEFTFEFEDENGEKGQATAKVNWINKKQPPNNNQSSNKPPISNNQNSNKVQENPQFEKNNENNATIQENETKKVATQNYYSKNIKISILESGIVEKLSLTKNELKLNKSLIEKFGNNSEYFELYLLDNKNIKVKLNKEKIKMIVTIDSLKKFLGIYKVNNDGNTQKLIYKRINNNQIELNIDNLDKYIIEYEKEENDDYVKKTANENENQTSKTEENDNNILWYTIGLLLFLAIIGVSYIAYKSIKEK